MSDKDAQIERLEQLIDELQFDLHAAKVAITVLSISFNSLSQSPGLLGDTFKKLYKEKGKVEFDHEVADDYQEKLIEKIASLLASNDN